MIFIGHIHSAHTPDINNVNQGGIELCIVAKNAGSYTNKCSLSQMNNYAGVVNMHKKYGKIP